MEADLTLEKAKKLVRQREAVKQQAAHLKGTASDQSGLEEVKTRYIPKNKRFTKPQSKAQTCQRCGKSPHSFQRCPARDAVCFKCDRKGHYGSQCLSKGVAEITENMSVRDPDPDSDEFYLDSAQTGETGKAWKLQVTVNSIPVTFKVDTGAEVTAVSENTWKSMPQTPTLQKATKTLCGPDCKPLTLLGETEVHLQVQQRKCSKENALKKFSLWKTSEITYSASQRLEHYKYSNKCKWEKSKMIQWSSSIPRSLKDLELLKQTIRYA